MAATMSVRATLLDTWEEVTLDLPPATTIAELKRMVLAASKIRRPAAEYVVKYNGAELYEEGATVGSAGVAGNGAVIVLRRKRAAVR